MKRRDFITKIIPAAVALITLPVTRCLTAQLEPAIS